MRSSFSLINVYSKKNIRSKVVTQLLYGDTFKKINKKNDWIKIKNDTDNYIGYIKKRKFPVNEKNTHKVCSLFALMFAKPNKGSKIKKRISFSSRVKVTDKKNNFYKADGLWVKKKDLKKINHKTKDIFKNIKKFTNVKYKWGGKHYAGVDCSGLIQLFFNFNNKFCPRDTKDQIKYFKKKIQLNKVRRNDLIFWKGHVAIVISKNSLLHAYGPVNKTVVMSIKKTIDRIYKTANLKVIGIRRIT